MNLLATHNFGPLHKEWLLERGHTPNGSTCSTFYATGRTVGTRGIPSSKYSLLVADSLALEPSHFALYDLGSSCSPARTSTAYSHSRHPRTYLYSAVYLINRSAGRVNDAKKRPDCGKESELNCLSSIMWSSKSVAQKQRGRVGCKVIRSNESHDERAKERV